jgi:Lrp/AsnC family leucine-responsive transcriptional regulator
MARAISFGLGSYYTAKINPAVLGLRTMVVIRLRTTHEHIHSCLKQFAKTPHVMEVLRLTGEDCLILKVFVPSPQRHDEDFRQRVRC